MTNKPFDTKTLKQGPLTFRIEWYYDSDGDSSHLGEPTATNPWNRPVYDLRTDEVWVNGKWYDKNGRALSEQDYDDTHADARGDRGKYRYVSGFQHSGNGTDFAKTSAEICQQVIAEHGSLDQASRSYIFADVKRLKALWAGDWWYTGCLVTLTVDGEELAQDSLGGIESDSDDDYKKEVEEERISQCKAQALASLPETIERLNKLIEVLSSVSGALQS